MFESIQTSIRIATVHVAHLKERPFKCTHCPKAFYYTTDLQRHEQIHSDKYFS